MYGVGGVVARFVATGDVLLAGTFQDGQASISPDDEDSEFIIRDSAGVCVALVDSEGNMLVAGTLSEAQTSLAATSAPEFIVQDAGGGALCVIDDMGNMGVFDHMHENAF